MSYVIGMDIGTSGLKSIIVNKEGHVVESYHVTYKTSHPKSGYSEMNPEVWYEASLESLQYLLKTRAGQNVKGISFSGQMHGLVAVDKNGEVIRPAILWNDTRTSKNVRDIISKLSLDKILKSVHNTVLEGFTLPKLMWVKENEPENFEKIYKIMLPKDYVVYRLTNNILTEPSDFSGTLLYDVKNETYADELMSELDIDPSICPKVIESHGFAGNINDSIKKQLNINTNISVYQGGADNACGALGAGITDDSKQLVSIGTSGVALSIENSNTFRNDGSVHYFNHCVPNQKYIMGVTLSAGSSLEWLKDQFSENESFDEFMYDFTKSPAGANGLLFTPYLHGERTPYNDADIRGSFIGLDRRTSHIDFKRSVVEGITFSINETLEIMRKNDINIKEIISIGGGAKNKAWLKIQSNIFNADITTRTEEQGPAYGAAMLAAMGESWFDTFDEMIKEWIHFNESIYPNQSQVDQYKKLFDIYKQVYEKTVGISRLLKEYS